MLLYLPLVRSQKRANSSVNDAQLFLRSDIVTVSVGLGDFKIELPDADFVKILQGAANEEQDIDGKWTTQTETYTKGLRNIYEWS